MPRKKWVVGNWKMYTNAASARALAEAVVKGLGGEPGCGVAVCPPFPYLGVVREALRGSAVLLGAQNCYCQTQWAFTPDVSPATPLDPGRRLLIEQHGRAKIG